MKIIDTLQQRIFLKRDNSLYDLHAMLQYLGIIIVFFISCKLTKSLSFPILIPIALYYIGKRRFEALFFIFLIVISSIVCNGYFVPKKMALVLSQRVLLFMLAFSIPCIINFGKKHTQILNVLCVFLWYTIYMAIVSVIGWAPLISELKIFLFITCFVAFYFISYSITQKKIEINILRSMILAVISFFLLGSILLIPFPAISNLSNIEMSQISTETISLYKGITSQPQCLGLVVVMCGIVLFGDFIFSVQYADSFYILLLISIPYLVFKTSSRTAMGGLISGMFFLFWCMIRSHTQNNKWKIKLQHYILLFCILMSIIVFWVPSSRNKINRYILKFDINNENPEVKLEKIMASRQGKLDSALENWKKSPIFGNGFQVYEWMSVIKVNSLSRLIAAPVEKSTWIYAILEEGGIVGEVIFCLLAFYIISTLIYKKAYIGASSFFTMLVLNLGEFAMFSISGVGGFAWGMVFVGCVLDTYREQEFRPPAVSFTI